MEPVGFPESNKSLGAPAGMEDAVLPLPVWSDGQQCISLWRPSLRERLSILLFGRVWLSVLMGSTQPPVSLAGRRKQFDVTVVGVEPPNRRAERLRWYVRQLLPLRYESTYIARGLRGDYQERCTWRMWFGRCFQVERVALDG